VTDWLSAALISARYDGEAAPLFFDNMSNNMKTGWRNFLRKNHFLFAKFI